MMTQSLNGNDSPFHCMPEADGILPSQDLDICIYPDSMRPIQPTSFEKDFTIEGDKVYANLSKSSGSSSPSSTNQLLPNMEMPICTSHTLPRIETFSRSIDSGISSPSSCDGSLQSPLGVTPAVRRTWQTKHPISWTSEDVLDWIFKVADLYRIDHAIKSEAFQDYTGRDLLAMPPTGFIPLSPDHYHIFSMNFEQLRERSRFNGPDSLQDNPLLSSTSEHLLGHGSKSLSDFDCDMVDSSTTGIGSSDSATLIQIDSYNYPVDLTDKFPEVSAQRQAEAASDDGYSSGSDRTQVITHTNTLSRHQNNNHYKSAQIPVLTSLVDDPDNMEDEDVDLEEETLSDEVRTRPQDQPRTRGRKPGQTTRGNHLWEFVRDLLKDSRYNPTLIKWENRELGVFRFVQSAAVAKMWGRRKNNQTMNYEKLSRAMRFCRDKQYFAGLPKGGKYPKKLCFRFGERAYGWQTDD